MPEERSPRPIQGIPPSAPSPDAPSLERIEKGITPLVVPLPSAPPPSQDTTAARDNAPPPAPPPASES
jgi:hypothetical protein